MSRRALVTLWALAGAVFAATLGSMLVPGVLPVFAQETGISMADVGRSNAVFGLAYAVAAPVIAWLVRRREPFRVLLVGLPLVAVVAVAVSQVDSAPQLMAVRVVQAVTVAAVVPMCTVHAGSIVAGAHRSRALSISFTGMVLSSLVGAPLGNLLAGAVGARATFVIAGGIAALATAAVLAVRSWQPALRTAGEQARRRESVASVVWASALVVLAATLATALLEGAATGGLNTFISPFLASATGASGALLSALLLCYGVAGLAGNGLLGGVADRWGPARVLTGLGIAAAASVACLAFVSGPLGAAVALLAWGFCSWAINPPLQALIVGNAGAHINVVVGINSSLIYTGTSLGAALASSRVQTGQLDSLPFLSAALFLGCAATAAVAWAVSSRARRRAAVLSQVEPTPTVQ
ncbi:MFS transporter [Demequina sp. NBRC 110055]|uniref:MFS transporter n=1 Tax=Demequina sp. NBRC 110055 TaxID=1570344 RepID=UPI001F3D5D41|nr:MFS transporter [Demequina sp. NBRC 110055]